MNARAVSVAEADSAYARGEYAAAVEAYAEIARSQGVSSGLLYNMGNAYAKGGDSGHALICYVRALRLDPANAGAKSNIEYIESKVVEANKAEVKNRKVSVEPDSPSFFSAIRKFISRDHLSDTWAAWGVASFLLFVGCVALYIFTRNVLARKIGFFGGFIFFGISAISVAFAFMAASYKTNEGVIVTNKVKLHTDSSPSSKENPTALTRGTRMEVLDSVPVGKPNPQWYKVRLNSDFIGWITASDFETVNL